MLDARKNIDLIKDIDEISEKGIQAFGLLYDESGHSNLHDPLLRWCDFLLRYIAPQKRIILKSDRFPENIHDGARVGLQRIEMLFTTGGDVNPYQSKTLTLFNDTSGKKATKRTDNLWADWEIHHLHLPLNPVSSSKKYSDRAEWVLFLKVYSNAVLFIDIKHHDKNTEPNLFSQRDLVETFIRNWPEAAEIFEMKGISGLACIHPTTDSDIANLRKNGINLPVVMDGKAYAPLGMGITTARTAVSVSTYRNKIYHCAKHIEKIFMDEDSPYIKEIKSLGVNNPEFKMHMFDDGGLGIVEINTRKGWKFLRKNADASHDVFSFLNNALMPEWASPVVLQFWEKTHCKMEGIEN